MRERGLVAKHGLGQHFLVSRQVLARIERAAGIIPGENLLEIGPGLGFLTHYLLSAGARVEAFETDRTMVAWLSEVFGGVEEFSLHHADFLKADLSSLSERQFRVVANLPYNITTPIFERLFELENLNEIIVMIQRQVAERILAPPGTKAYGALSLFVDFHATPSLLFHVSPGNFYPAPSVYSSVIKMKTRREKPLSGEPASLFFSLVRAVFSSRRKVLRNSLRESAFTGLNSEESDRLLELAELEGGIRGEQLAIEDFFVLARAWSQSGLARPPRSLVEGE